MCSPWTITGPVRWRIRDWTYMLCPCRFPSEEEEEEEEGTCSSVPQASSEAMVVDTGNRCKQGRRVMHSPKQTRNSRDDDYDDSSWPSFAEEDYIVFCFGEDGTFDVVKDGRERGGDSEHPNSMNRESRTSSRPVNRKLNYGEENEDQDYIQGQKDDDPSTYEGDSIISDKEGEEEGSIYLDASSPPDEIIIQGGEDEIEESIIESSSSSNKSNDSAASFAFPVLHFEGIGSPVQMPRSQDLQLRKHKGRGLSFRCCRF